ncbi:hypothetical protein BHE74_00045053 [Ensete ventricosum]|nr:hypothetical protein BHE74_00045053 [Ensete ventricosum]
MVGVANSVAAWAAGIVRKANGALGAWVPSDAELIDSLEAVVARGRSCKRRRWYWWVGRWRVRHPTVEGQHRQFATCKKCCKDVQFNRLEEKHRSVDGIIGAKDGEVLEEGVAIGGGFDASGAKGARGAGEAAEGWAVAQSLRDSYRLIIKKEKESILKREWL